MIEVVIPVLAFVLYFVIEVVIPVLAFVLYFVARGMLARVINDRHHCRGRPGRAVGWAAVWATAYTAPLAGTVWLVHYMHLHS